MWNLKHKMNKQVILIVPHNGPKCESGDAGRWNVPKRSQNVVPWVKR